MYREIGKEEIKTDKTLGYQYFIDRLHPLATKNVGKVSYHRHLASIKENRWLSSTEIVHHIDGNKLNNTVDNLQVLSVLEHKALHDIENGFSLTEKICPVCNTTFKVYTNTEHKRITCSLQCAAKHQIKWDISKEELEVLIWNMSYTDISKKYPISDVGAKKRAKSLGCLLPPPYFFSKNKAYIKELRKLNNIPDLST